MEIPGLKCNRCGKRIFLDEKDSPTWAVMEVNIVATHFHAILHFCPPCFSEFESGVQKLDDVLTTGQKRMVNPDLLRVMREDELEGRHTETVQDQFSDFMAGKTQPQEPAHAGGRKRRTG